MPRKRIGDLLIEAGLITSEQLQDALLTQSKTRERLGDVLISKGYISERQLLEALEFQLGIPRVVLGRQKPEAAILALVPETLARRHMAFPIRRDGNRLTVAMSDPLDYFALDELRMSTGLSIQPVIAAKDELRLALDRSYGMRESIEEVMQAAARQIPLMGFTDDVGDENAPVVRLVNQWIRQAVEWHASDIHFDPDEDGVRVRIRVDGVMRPEQTLPSNLQHVLVARLKVMANLNVAERRLPQDGRFRQNVNGHDVDVRVSTLPTIRGEKVVLRIFDLSAGWQRLDKLAFTASNLSHVKRMLAAPSGMVLVTGPTGSGKTSTVYAALGECSTPDVNVMTIEDPVEYQIPGVNQVAVNLATGLTFAAGLRATLRQDPDIVMVGEIRDAETAEIAVRAALTGHLVFSTLHTGGAVETIARLMDMGIEPYLVGSALTGIIGQRLVRRVCSECAERYTLTEREQAWIEPVFESWKQTEPDFMLPNGRLLDAASVNDLSFMTGRGCASCGYTGYHGRMAVQEVLQIDAVMQRLIVARSEESQLRLYAEQKGFHSLLSDGLQKAAIGWTTVSEVLRVAWRDT